MKKISANQRRQTYDGHWQEGHWSGDCWNRNGHYDPDDPPQPCLTTTSYANQATFAATAPTLPPSSTLLPGQNSESDMQANNSASIVLIISMAGGAFVLLVTMGLLIWCLRQKNRRQQMLSHSKTGLMPSRSPEADVAADSTLTSQQQSDSGSLQLTYTGSEKGDKFIGSDNKSNSDSSGSGSGQPYSFSAISVPQAFGEGHFQDCNLNSSLTDNQQAKEHSSISSLPTQKPTFPPPTPRERRISEKSNTGKRNILTNAAAPPSSFLENAQKMRASSNSINSAAALSPEAKDFYVDMLHLVIDPNLPTHRRTGAAGALYPDLPSPSTPLPTDHPLTTSPSFSSANLQAQKVPGRPRSANSLSQKKSSGSGDSSNGTNGGGNSPRVSREARRLVQNLPLPPPPPNGPPPAIPCHASDLPARGRSSTVNSTSKRANQSPASVKNKGRRSRASSISSAKNLTVLPPKSPPPLQPPNNSQLSRHDGHQLPQQQKKQQKLQQELQLQQQQHKGLIDADSHSSNSQNQTSSSERLKMIGSANVRPLSPPPSDSDSRPTSWCIENRDSIMSTSGTKIPSQYAYNPTTREKEEQVIEVIIADTTPTSMAKKYAGGSTWSNASRGR